MTYLTLPSKSALKVVVAVDSALCRASIYRLPRDVVLDRVLGRAETFEYTGSTTL